MREGMAEKSAYSRRDFLKIIGAGAGMAATGCGRDLPEKFIPYVVQPDESIPGVATWYSGTCRECSAGCGTLARVREGRVVKLEGNPLHPINKGGLCAIGQSSLQALYDPDRIRVPLQRDVSKGFKPLGWTDAIAASADALAACASGGEGVIVTRRLSGSEAAVVDEFCAKLPGLKHISFDTFGWDLVDSAAEQVFGPNMRTRFDFSQADVVVSFGADYLESWLSPVEFARQWAERRKLVADKKISKVVHFEPRLSLTGGNADHWVMNQPGSERELLLALLKSVVEKTGGANVPATSREAVKKLVEGVDRKACAARGGVSEELIDTLAGELVQAKQSLVVAGGAAASGPDALECAVLANLVNVALGNVGKSVTLSKAPAPAKSGFEELVTLGRDLRTKKRKLAVMVLAGVNPAYVLPEASKFREAFSGIGTVIAVSAHLDETTNMANIVLPVSHQLESWGDSEPLPGVFALNQPAMAPLYQTQSLGDTLISLAAHTKINKPFEKFSGFYDYMRARWKARTGEGDFEARWVKYVEHGGDFSAKAAVAPALGELTFNPASLHTEVTKAPETLSVMVYPSVNSFDGSSANRPWMQELPSTTTSAVWGSWVEMHPDLAAKLGVATGDSVQVVTPTGYIGAPAYITKFIAPGLVAVPLGQGHESYGRFAVGVGANGLQALAVSESQRFAGYISAATDVRPRGNAKEDFVTLQGSDSQYRRGIVRSILASQAALLLERNGHKIHHEEPEGKEEGGAEEEDPLALGPRPLPKQMYRQTEHVLYQFGMSIDLSNCTGCSACVIACQAENNVPTVGKTICNEGREMSWIRIERYLDGPAHQPVEGYAPMMCQQCNNAPCEPVCPVYATYHTEEGLNTMVYNRCVGTRYCANNCSYKVRRFNFFKYTWAEPLNWQLNPDVTVREVGVMEKCSFCIQRIREGTNKAKDLGRPVIDGDIIPACASSCPTKAITFGNLKDGASAVSKLHADPRVYKVLDVELNTQPAVAYLARVKNQPIGV